MGNINISSIIDNGTVSKDGLELIEKIIEENSRLIEENIKLKNSFGYSRILNSLIQSKDLFKAEIIIRTKEELDEYVQNKINTLSDSYLRHKRREELDFKFKSFYGSIKDKFVRVNWSRRKKMRVIARFLDSEFKTNE